METPRYPSIGEYGAIGNLETVALVSRYGSIDWCPLPDVESPGAFAAILDADRGGRFQVQPVLPYGSAQTYLDRTNVLATEFYGPTGRARLVDLMPFPDPVLDDPTPSVVYRKLSCTEGSMRFSVEFVPRFDYAREIPRISGTDRGVVARGARDELYLSGPVTDGPPTVTDDPDVTLAGEEPRVGGRTVAAGPQATPVGDDAARTTLPMESGETAWFALRHGHDGPHDPTAFQRRLDETVRAWRAWVEEGGNRSREIDEGRWERLVDRSALALKLLTHRETGAIAAAPTTSLPEDVGGSRNWDYRYNWIRDAALTVQALHKLGHVDEARAYFSWLLDRVYEDPASIRPLYGLHGGTDLAERTLGHLEGYRRSAPVRVGNAAAGQRQLDVYGELVLGLYETTRFGETISESDWAALREVVDYVAAVWDTADAGIWEVRSEPRHFVHSKVMCWVALDRGIEVVEGTDFEGPVDSWREARRAVRDAVLERGYDEAIGSFLRSFGAEDALDATALLIPIVGFLPIDDPRVQGTIDAVRRRLTTPEGLVYRYEGDDGLPGGEGTFVVCSFWLVDALALSGRLEAAEALFDSVVSHASPLGLLSEEIAAGSGALLGNYPQAFSHIGLINSVLYLDRARENRQPGPEPLGAESRSSGSAPAEDGPSS